MPILIWLCWVSVPSCPDGRCVKRKKYGGNVYIEITGYYLFYVKVQSRMYDLTRSEFVLRNKSLVLQSIVQNRGWIYKSK